MANEITTTTAALYIDTRWTPELNRAIEFIMVHGQLFEDRSGLLPTGNILYEPSRHNLTANTKAASTDATPEALTETRQTYTVDTHQVVAQDIEDIAEIQSHYGVRRETTMAGSYALGRAFEVACANLFDDNTTQVVGAYGAELPDDQVLRAWRYIADAGRPPSMVGKPVVSIASPAMIVGFLKAERYSNSLYNGDTKGMAVREAQVGKLYGTTVYQSNLLSGTAPSASGTWFVRGHFFKIIQRRPTTHTWYSPLSLSWIVSMDQIYGVFERLEADEAASVTTNSRALSVHLKSLK